MKAMVVDDEDLLRQVFVSVLAVRGHQAVAFAEAESALAAYQREPFDLALVDWMLPGMDGLTLTQELRRQAAGNDTYVLVVTSRDRPGDLEAVLDAGADDYIAKPIDPAHLDVRLRIAERAVQHLRARNHAERRLAQAHDDMLSVLDGLRLGTATTDASGRLTFASRITRRLLRLDADEALGRPWDEVLPTDASTLDAVRSMWKRAPAARDKVRAVLARPNGLASAVEIEVKDDPRDHERKLLFFYDVTELERLRQELTGNARFHDIVGRSEPMLQVFRLIEDLAQVDTTVLISGATGTGKELVARAIHRSSGRRDGPFVPVNCAGLSDELLASQLFGHRRGSFTGAVADSRGVFEEATGGTIFLDEIGDISPRVQNSLLRVLQEHEIVRLGEARPRKVDVRVLVATNRDLDAEVASGRFRADLLYRIRVARVVVPELASRRADIPLLATAFLELHRARMGKPVEQISVDAMRALTVHSWPGNVRELQSAIEFGVIRCRGSSLELQDLPSEVVTSSEAVLNPAQTADEEVRQRVLAALEAAGNNRTRAAKIYGVSRATFYRLLGRFGIA